METTSSSPDASPFIVTWLDETSRPGDVQAVDSLLDRLHAEFQHSRPTLVTIQRAPSGDLLTIGLGRRISVLNFVSGHLEPPYYVAVGSGRRSTSIEFYCSNQWSEFPGRQTVSLTAARNAVREFCERGIRSPKVAWEEL